LVSSLSPEKVNGLRSASLHAVREFVRGNPGRELGAARVLLLMLVIQQSQLIQRARCASGVT